MSRGVPIAIKCPKCRRGQHNYANKVLGVRKTGLVEKRTTRLQARGRRIGARVRRGQMHCLDCGHTWWSTHPDVAVSVWKEELEARRVKR